MKNIVMITSLYPSDDVKFLNNTSVCHYFAKEWVRLGYKVHVFHTYYLFPRFYYPLLKIFRNVLATNSSSAILDKYLPNEYNYSMDGVNVYRLPIHKIRPGKHFSKKAINIITNRIIQIIEQQNISPNAIVGHFLCPSINIISLLKDKYPHTTTSISIHGKCRDYVNLDGMLQKIDYIGYRSVPIGECFEKVYGVHNHFYCFSGMPIEYISTKDHSFVKPINRFLYVGNLMKRKHPDCLVYAINRIYKEDDFVLTYVGNGNEYSRLKRISEKLHIEDKIIFKGRIQRNSVIKEMDNADVFIMISENETFGLVYLEAMARGCIVVASSNEGMEGIIIDGINGFLCPAGDSQALSGVIKRIRNLTSNELNQISRNALNTARKMTDTLMAESYINSVLKE